MSTMVPLVRNDSSASKTAAPIQALACNLLPKMVRHDTMEGRDFLVVPMVILTEGVHKGSQGPLYYPSDELGKTPDIWNHKPIVVYHPELDGKGLSACSPTILTQRKVGVMMNTKYEKGKLKSEAWLEQDRANKVDERIMAAVEGNEMMEVSTGVFVDQEEKEGEWKGEKYAAVARNYRPDHLAILPDKIGACSIADGAGFLRNQSAEEPKSWRTFIRQLIGLANNQMSFDNTRSELQTALREKLGISGDNNMMVGGPYIVDTYSNFFIYEQDGKLWRQGYSSDDTGVQLEGKPVEVNRVTEYRTVDGAYVGNIDQTQKGSDAMNKKQLVDALIANSKGALAETDRERLMAFSEDQLKLFGTPPAAPAPPAQPPTGNAAPAAAPVTNATPPAAAPVVPPPAAPQAPAPAAPVTVDEYIAKAPAQMREMLTNGLASYNEEKAALVEKIAANANNTFTKEDLSARPLGELRGLARLAGVDAAAVVARAPNYSGQGNVPSTTNTAAEEVLSMPTMNFAKEPAAAAK